MPRCWPTLLPASWWENSAPRRSRRTNCSPLSAIWREFPASTRTGTVSSCPGGENHSQCSGTLRWGETERLIGTLDPELNFASLGSFDFFLGRWKRRVRAELDDDNHTAAALRRQSHVLDAV